MKIYCTVKEFGLLVRACEKSQCYSCALREVCKADQENPRRIEDFITAETIEKEAMENDNQDDWNGIQPHYEDMYPGIEQR